MYTCDEFTIDFGDGAISTFTEDIGKSPIVHNYEKEGFYEIKISNTIRSLVTLYEDPGEKGIGLVQLFNIASNCYDIGGFSYSAFTCNRQFYHYNDYVDNYSSPKTEPLRSLNMALSQSQNPQTLYNSTYWQNNIPAIINSTGFIDDEEFYFSSINNERRGHLAGLCNHKTIKINFISLRVNPQGTMINHRLTGAFHPNGFAACTDLYMTHSNFESSSFEFGGYIISGENVGDRIDWMLFKNLMEYTDCGFENLTAIYLPNITASDVKNSTYFPWCKKNGQIYNQLQFICKDTTINCAGDNGCL